MPGALHPNLFHLITSDIMTSTLRVVQFSILNITEHESKKWGFIGKMAGFLYDRFTFGPYHSNG